MGNPYLGKPSVTGSHVWAFDGTWRLIPTSSIAGTGGSGGETQAEFVVTQATGSLPNAMVLTAGPNITINSGSGIVSITGSAGGSGPAGEVSASYIVAEATASLPNALVLTAGPNITINSGSGIISITGSSGAGTPATLDYYQGFTSSSLDWTSETFTGFHNVPAVFTDEVQQNITRTNSTFTVTDAGKYWIGAYFNVANPTPNYMQIRVRQSGSTLLAGSQSETGRILMAGILDLSANDSFNIEYVVHSDPAFGNWVAGTKDGETTRTGQITIYKIETDTIITGGSGETSASYILAEATASLPNAFVLTAGPNITINSGSGVISITGSAGGSVSGSIGTQLHDTTHSPIALYNFQTHMSDSSGNGYHLSLESGNELYGTIAGLPCFYFDNGSGLYRTIHDAELSLTGAMTVEAIVSLTPGTAGVIIDFSASGETEATNILYNISVTTANVISTLWESGAGTNRQGTNVYVPSGPFHLAWTRDAAGTLSKLYINGSKVLEETLLGAASGGSSGQLRIGDSAAGNPIGGYIASLKIIGSELSAAQVLAEYERTLGPAYSATTITTAPSTVTGTAPTEYESLYALYDPTTVVTSGSQVIAWTNKTGSGPDLANDAGSGPSITSVHPGFNGYQSVDFNGTSMFLTGTNFTLTSFTSFIVFSAAAAGDIVYEHGPNINTTEGHAMYTGQEGCLTVRRGGTLTNKYDSLLGNSWIAGHGPTVVAHQYLGEHVSNLCYIDNEYQRRWVAYNQSGNPGIGSATQTFYLGARGGSSLFFSGSVVEMAFFTPALSNYELRRVASWYAEKYKLQSPSIGGIISTVSSGSSGSSGGVSQAIIPLVSGKQELTLSTWEIIGSVFIAPGDYGALTPHVETYIAECEVQMYDVTSGKIVAGTSLSTTSSLPQALSSSALTLSSSRRTYEAQGRLTGSASTGTCTYFALVFE